MIKFKNIHTITTESGSVYKIAEQENKTLLVNTEGAIKNPRVFPSKEFDDWQPATVVPWPVRLGEVLVIVRPFVPWGKGRLKITSPVRIIEINDPTTTSSV